jgi:hypothetical protein
LTKKFDSVHQALGYAVYLMGGTEKSRKEIEATRQQKIIKQFGVPIHLDIYTLTNMEGETGEVGIEKFRTRYAIWLLTETGFGVRI